MECCVVQGFLNAFYHTPVLDVDGVVSVANGFLLSEVDIQPDLNVENFFLFD